MYFFEIQGCIYFVQFLLKEVKHLGKTQRLHIFIPKKKEIIYKKNLGTKWICWRITREHCKRLPETPETEMDSPVGPPIWLLPLSYLLNPSPNDANG